jgi:hypothetical protein
MVEGVVLIADMNDRTNDNNWTIEGVLNRLAEGKADPELASAQIVLSELIQPDDIASVTRESLEAAARSLGHDPGLIRIGKTRELANSISVNAPVPVLRKIMGEDSFASIMPGNLSRDEAMVLPIDKLSAHSTD